MRTTWVMVLFVVVGCSKRGSTTGGGDCSHVGDPLLAEAKEQELNGKDELTKKYARKVGPMMAAAMVKSCQDHQWSAATIAACSKEMPLKNPMTACDASMSAEQIAALRQDIGAKPITISPEDLAKIRARVQAGSAAVAGSGSAP